MAISDARPVIRRAATNTIGVWMQDTSGGVITGGLTGLAATVIKEDGSAATATGTPTEIGTTGYVTLQLAAAECTSTVLAVKIVCTNTDAVDACFVVYPEQAGDIRANLTQINSDAALIAKFAAAVGGNLVGTLTGSQTATTLTASTPAAATADLYNGRFLLMLTGGLAGKASKITDYAKVGDNGVFTVDSLGSAPTAGDTFLIL